MEASPHMHDHVLMSMPAVALPQASAVLCALLMSMLLWIHGYVSHVNLKLHCVEASPRMHDHVLMSMPASTLPQQ